jgi:hypothetical protein
VSQRALDPELPSLPSFTSLGRTSSKYIFQISLLILMESAMGCRTYANEKENIRIHPKLYQQERYILEM